MSLLWKKHAEILRDTMREVSHKSSITNGLGNAVKALQQHHIDSCIVYSDTLSDNLCYYLEAIFIHGLKDNFFEKVSTILVNNSHKLPEPNFWPLLMVFSHKDILTQINKLSQIQTDIGRCRALIRLALNEGLIESYLAAMIQDKSTIKHYYRDYSYLRDAEQPDIMKRYIEGLQVFEFKLACNSRMLNVWSPTPLILSGIWSPPLVPEPVFTGIDAASFFDIDNNPVRTEKKSTDHEIVNENEAKFFDSLLQDDSTKGFDDSLQNNFNEVESNPSSSVVSCPDPMPSLLYDEVIEAGEQVAFNQDPVKSEIRCNDQAILCSFEDHKCEEAENQQESNSYSATESYEAGNSKEHDLEDSTCVEDPLWPDGYNFGNRLVGKESWSSAYAPQEQENSNLAQESENTTEPYAISETYQELLQNYSPARSSILRTPDFQELIIQTSDTACKLNRKLSTSSSSVDDSEYEILPRNCSFLSANADLETRNLIKIIGKIANEQGLDTQKYQCKFCSRPIGMIYGKARVCNYDGYCYCQDCHDNEEYYIPSRIIHNWDFRKYKLSKQAMKFFQLIEDEPLLDIRQLNSQLYSISVEMKELQLLRTQLNYLRSYLFTCRESVAEEMRKKLWPKDYLYDHIHLYSFKDLINIPSRSLIQLLQKVVLFASKHVTDCELCRQKGFICEVCGSPEVIYPFELGEIYRCEVCLAVYHAACMSTSRSCPKCERIKKREDQSDCNWIAET